MVAFTSLLPSPRDDVEQAPIQRETVLYQVVADHLETFLATIDADPTAKGLLVYVRDESYAYLQCGILAHGADGGASSRTDPCVGSDPPVGRLRSHSLTLLDGGFQRADGDGPHVMRRTISQYYVNRAVEPGIERKQAQAGSVTFIQRFGSAINANLHLHMLFLEGVYVDRSEEGHKLRIGSGFGHESERPLLTAKRCASMNGFSLHADTHVPAHPRDQLERLLRYTAAGVWRHTASYAS